jgi:hypothetical protein
VTILGELAQILHVNFDDSGFPGAANDAVVQRPGKKLRKYGYEIETHQLSV